MSKRNNYIDKITFDLNNGEFDTGDNLFFSSIVPSLDKFDYRMVVWKKTGCIWKVLHNKQLTYSKYGCHYNLS